MIVAVVDGTAASKPVIIAASAAADRRGCGWTALHIETPDNCGANAALQTADMLAFATRIGGVVATLPAADEASGIVSYLNESRIKEIVLRAPVIRPSLRSHNDIVTQLLAKGVETPMLLVPVDRAEGKRHHRAVRPDERRAPISYLTALLSVATLAGALLLLRRLIGEEALSIVTLFPVLIISARYGLTSSIVTAVLSVGTYNLLVLQPIGTLTFAAPQNLLMLSALLAVAIYTSMVTGRLRARVALSDCSAQENAGLAAFGLDLTQASDWETTAKLVCEKATALFDVDAVLFREIGGDLVVAGTSDGDPQLTPLDRTALELAWNDGQEVGSGTQTLPDCDWRFRPLRTSLGVLAILAIAREDGRNPVPAQRLVLFETFLAQAALAHERLRLEDKRAARGVSDTPE